jgi:phage FluMu protein Com
VTTYLQVRCPNCRRLVCEAVAGSRLRAKCVRCGEMFERLVEQTVREP